jgi:hypothetical protein
MLRPSARAFAIIAESPRPASEGRSGAVIAPAFRRFRGVSFDLDSQGAQAYIAGDAE